MRKMICQNCGKEKWFGTDVEWSEPTVVGPEAIDREKHDIAKDLYNCLTERGDQVELMGESFRGFVCDRCEVDAMILKVVKR